jgi:hypothetical protein
VRNGGIIVMQLKDLRSVCVPERPGTMAGMAAVVGMAAVAAAGCGAVLGVGAGASHPDFLLRLGGCCSV